MAILVITTVVKKRVEGLLAKLGGQPQVEALRGVRAVEALERAGTAEARGLLKELAAGAADAPLTRAAAAALSRLRR